MSTTIMDYFSKGQHIALPVTSEKEPLSAELVVSTPDSPTPPASRLFKFKKTLKIFVPLLLIGVALRWIVRTNFREKWFNHHPPLPFSGLRGLDTFPRMGPGCHRQVFHPGFHTQFVVRHICTHPYICVQIQYYGVGFQSLRD
jgi:hypothetical protein